MNDKSAEKKLVVLVNTNRLQPAPAPVALDYLNAELEAGGVEVRILDLCHVKSVRKAISEFFRDVKPDLVAVSIRNLDDVVFNCFIAEEIRPMIESIRLNTGSPIVLGGSGFSIAPELMLDYFGLDLGIAGEGEEALPMLLDSLNSPERYPEIPGLVWREASEFKRNALGSADVNGFCLAKRGSICYGDYSYKKGRRGGAGVQTRRGCSNRCIYCAVPNIEGSTVRLRDPKGIADEIENLVSLGVTRIFLADSEFNYPKEQALAICDEFLARGFREKLTWQAYISPGQFDEELAGKMKEAGCDLVYTTVDSGVDSLLERWNKPFRQEDIVTTVRACQKAELNAVYSLTIGGPGETMDTLLQTVNLMGSLKPARVTFGEPPGLRIYPNTPLETLVRDEGFTSSNPNLHGKIAGNENLLHPVYYLSHKMSVLVPIIQTYRKIGELHHRLVRK